jgi:hypothetical protein
MPWRALPARACSARKAELGEAQGIQAPSKGRALKGRPSLLQVDWPALSGLKSGGYQVPRPRPFGLG